MSGIKRKSTTSARGDAKSKSKKLKTEKSFPKHSTTQKVTHHAKSSNKPKTNEDSDELLESDTSEDENGFYGFSANKNAGEDMPEDDDSEDGPVVNNTEASEPNIQAGNKTTSREEHRSPALAALNGMLSSVTWNRSICR